MVLQFEAVSCHNLALSSFNFIVKELNDLAGVYTHHVIMMGSTCHLEDCVGAIEVMPFDNARAFKLGQYPIDGREPNIFASLQERTIDIFRTQMALAITIKNLENAQAWQGRLKAGFLERKGVHGNYLAVCMRGVRKSWSPARAIRYTGWAFWTWRRAGCASLGRHVNTIRTNSTVPQVLTQTSPMQRSIPTVTSIGLYGLLLAACANTELPHPADLPHISDLPFVHKIDIQQGNVITQEMMAQLQPGMDKKKVNFIMGSPIILDTFHSNRWDYVYTFQPGGGRVERRHVTLYFKDDKLDHATGDIKPAVGRLVVDMRQDKTVDVPLAPEQGLVAKIKNSLPLVGAKKPAKQAAKAIATADASVDEPAAAEAAIPPKHVMTPIERAAREEQGGPGVLTTFKDALPFTKKSSEPAASELARDQVAHAEPVTTADAAPAAAGTPEENKPGLMKRLKSALPFGTDESAESAAPSAEPADNTLNGDHARHASLDSNAAPTEADDVAESLVVPPPTAPAGQGLATDLDREIGSSPELAAEPKPPSDIQEVVTPSQAPKRKRGFFARLFGSEVPN